jgi:hypothetical protein
MDRRPRLRGSAKRVEDRSNLVPIGIDHKSYVVVREVLGPDSGFIVVAPTCLGPQAARLARCSSAMYGNMTRCSTERRVPPSTRLPRRYGTQKSSSYRAGSVPFAVQPSLREPETPEWSSHFRLTAPSAQVFSQSSSLLQRCAGPGDVLTGRSSPVHAGSAAPDRTATQHDSRHLGDCVPLEVQPSSQASISGRFGPCQLRLTAPCVHELMQSAWVEQRCRLTRTPESLSSRGGP